MTKFLIFIYFSCIITPTIVSAKAKRELFAKVIKVQGDVYFKTPKDKGYRAFIKGFKFPNNTYIKTGPKSYAIVKYAYGVSKIVIGPNSKVVLKNKGEEKGSTIDVLGGFLRSNVNKEKRGDRDYLVRTRNAVMGIRGTDFAVRFNKIDQKTQLIVVKGQVAFAKYSRKLSIKDNLSQNSIEVKKGEMSGVLPMYENPSEPSSIPERVNEGFKRSMTYFPITSDLKKLDSEAYNDFEMGHRGKEYKIRDYSKAIIYNSSFGINSLSAYNGDSNSINISYQTFATNWAFNDNVLMGTEFGAHLGKFDEGDTFLNVDMGMGIDFKFFTQFNLKVSVLASYWTDQSAFAPKYGVTLGHRSVDKNGYFWNIKRIFLFFGKADVENVSVSQVFLGLNF